MSTEAVWCSIVFLGVLLLVAPSDQSGSSRTTLYNVCLVHTSGCVQYMGRYHEYIGGCSVHRSFQYKSKAFISLLPHMNHGALLLNYDIPLMY